MMNFKKNTAMKFISFFFASILLTGCLSRGTFRSNLENYNGIDASVIYLHDSHKYKEESLSFYEYNQKKECFEITEEKQLTTAGRFKTPSGKIIKFTIKPNIHYASKSMSYRGNGTYILAYSFIPKPNKKYYIGRGEVIELPENTTSDYLEKLFTSENKDLEKIAKAEVWNIKENTCKGILGAPDI